MGLRSRPRARWVVAPPLVLTGLAVIGAVIALDQPSSWTAWAPEGLLVAVGAVLVAVGTYWLKPWEARRSAKADEERRAVDQLRRHLGRRDRLPRLGDPAASALALRVHPATAAPKSEPRGGAAPRARRSWRRPGQGRPATSDHDLPTFVDRVEGDVGSRTRDWMRNAAK